MSVKTRHPSSSSDTPDAGRSPERPSSPPSPTLPPAGWYADPSGHARLRFWTGTAWSPWASDGTTARPDPEGVRRRLNAADLEHLDFVEHVFLPEAAAVGFVTMAEAPLLEGLARRMEEEARAAGAALAEVGRPAAPSRPPTAVPSSHVAPPARMPAGPVASTMPLAPVTTVRAPGPTPALVILRPEPEPSPLKRWWDRTREAVGSDLAVHGLAYVGVLLFFVGAFGLVVFAFADVSVALRPVAELVIALAPFAAAALLLRRGATIVGRALEVMGGLLVPVMVTTSFLDDNGVPPDLYGAQLAVALTVLTALVAVGYAAWTSRHPQSALRYLVAPVAWLAVGMATLGLGREIPDGKAVATPCAAQTAAILAALVVSVALARWRPEHRLAAPTRVAALPGLVVIASLSLLSGYAESWPVLPALASGALVVVALELLRDGIRPVVVGVVEPLWWALTSLVLAAGAVEESIPTAAVAAVSAAGFLLVLEAAAAARRPSLALLLPAIGLATALVATTTDATWAAVAFGGASLWAAARRTAPFDLHGTGRALDSATAVLPGVTLVCMAEATTVPEALFVGALVVLAATVVGRLGLLRRTPGDGYWPMWSATGGGVVLGLTVLAWFEPVDWGATGIRSVVAALAVLTLAAVVGPVPLLWHPPVVTGVATLTWISMVDALDALGALEGLDPDRVMTVAVAVPALAALAMVVVAHLSGSRRADAGPSRVHRASLGLSGHALGLVAVALSAVPGWARVVTLALATAGWATTGWLDLDDRSPVGSALARLGAGARWVPLSLTAIGIPTTLVVTLDQAGWVPVDDQRSVFVVVGVAVAYAVITRSPLPERLLRVAAWAGFLTAAFVAVIADSRPGRLVALAAVPVVVATLPRVLRPRVMTWFAWATVAPVAGLLAEELFPQFDALAQDRFLATTLAAVGAALLVGGATADLRQRPWTPLLLPQHEWALAPCAVGAFELALAVLLSVAVLDPETGGWLVVAAASAALATALLSRAGIRAGVAVLLGWVSVMMLAGPEVEAQPFIAVVAVLGLLALARAMSAVTREATWWARWDLPLLVAAVPVATTALVVASGDASAAATFVAVGAEFLVVAGALWRHRITASVVGAIGAALVLVGAGTASTGWLALSLLALSVALTALAVPAHGPARTALQLGGVASAWLAWRLASAWWQLPDQRAVEVAAIGAGLVTVAAAAVAVTTRVERSWPLVWGGAAVTLEAVCAWDALTVVGVLHPGVDPSRPVAAGLLITAAALAGSAVAVGVPWLRDLTAAFAFGSLVVGMLAAGASTTAQVVTLSILSAACAVAVLAVARATTLQPWRRPLIELGTVSTLWALGAVAQTSSSPMLFVPVLAASAVLAAAIGVVLHRTLLQAAAPVLACAAWLVFSAEALDGNPQWVTVPVGLSTLVVVALWRHDRAEHGGPLASPEIVGLELVGIAFLVGSALVQAVTVSVAYAVLAAAIGVSVSAWGVVSRVRRRLAAGTVIVLVSVVLLVVVPLVAVLPSIEGAGFWVVVAAAGLVALAVAGLLDWGKATARRQLSRFAEATSGWE